MKKILVILFLLPTLLFAQVDLTYIGQSYVDTLCENVNGISIPRGQLANFVFKNNYVQACNTGGYMLQAGVENNTYPQYVNTLPNSQIIGNKFVWKGDQNANTITHGVFTGYEANARIMYNYLDYVPMGIIRKSDGMTDSTGVVAYNIVRNSPAVAMVVKGMNGVRIYNNTFYSEDSLYVSPGIGTWRGLIDVYKNDNPVADAKGVKIKNNIFYTKRRIININVMDLACLEGFECDYNVYWCEEGEPRFQVAGVYKTLAEWRAMGYDTHSQVMNPYFINTTDLVPSWRVQWGTPTEFDMGIATNAKWVVGKDIPLVKQSGPYWQQGARIYEGNMVIFYRQGRIVSGDSINIPLTTGKIVVRQGEIIID